MSDFPHRGLRVLLADNHPIFRIGLKSIVEMTAGAQVIAETGTAEERLQQLYTQQIDVLISELLMPAEQQAGALEALAEVRERFPDLAIIVVTTLEDGHALRAIFKLKIQGLMNKLCVAKELPAAIACLGRNRTYIASSTRNAMLEALEQLRARPKTLEQLSPREQEVLKMFAAGASINKIAEQLNRSKQTVSAQKISAMRKLRLTSDIALLTYLQKKIE